MPNGRQSALLPLSTPPIPKSSWLKIVGIRESVVQGHILQFCRFQFQIPRNGDAGKKVTKSHSINCNPFSRAMLSPLSTEKPTPRGLISNRLASSLSDIPNSLTAQKQKRLLAFTFQKIITKARKIENTKKCR